MAGPKSFSLSQIPSNCRIGGCPIRDTREICPSCPEWIPSRGSKYNRCQQWHAFKVTCDLPKESCATCPQQLPPLDPRAGRPNLSGMDWKDPDQVREYNMLKKRESRANAKGTGK